MATGGSVSATILIRVGTVNLSSHQLSIGRERRLWRIPSSAVDQAIVLNPARQPISFTSVYLFHTYNLGLASEKHHIVTAPRYVCGDNQVALNALASCQPFMQNAVEAVTAQILGFASKGMRDAYPGHIY